MIQLDSVMKTFEEVFNEAIKEYGTNCDEAFAKVMFNAGQATSIGDWLKTITDWTDCLQLAQLILIKLVHVGIDMNAAEIVLSVIMNHNDSKYCARMAIQYSEEGEKTLNEKASELANKILSESDDLDTREKLKRAVLAGFNLHHEDFDD